MLKKLFIAVLFGALAAFSVAAQSKADNFLGTWKLTKSEGFLKGTTIKSMVLKVSVVGGEFRIVKETEGVSANKKSYSTTRTSVYKINGASTTNLVPGLFSAVLVSYMDFLGKNKLRLRDTMQDTSERRSAVSYGGTEYWTLSDDEKTLTIETRSGSNLSKAIFTKE